MFSIEHCNPSRAMRNRVEVPDLDSLFSRFMGEPYFSGVHTWAPPADVAETENELKVFLDVPGMRKEDLKIELPGNNTLLIQGERKFEAQEGVKYTRQERFYGNFTRTFVLPSTLDANKISATFQDGVLEVVLPKAEASKARKIEVKAK
jgi:HSP20 family protein